MTRHRQCMAAALVVAILSVWVLVLTSADPVFADDGTCSTCTGVGGGTGQPTTTGDQDRGSVVTQGAAFPGSGASGAAGRAASGGGSCTGCDWAVSPACQGGTPTEEAACGNAVQACPPPAMQYRVYRSRAGGPWQLVDTVCLGPARQPPAGPEIARLVRERVETLLPAAQPSFQPPTGALVNLPTIFAAGEPATLMTAPFDVLGYTVVVSARATWTWSFGEGPSQSFDRPGGTYPNDDVTFTYRTLGTRIVRLRTSWQATYSIDGAGPYALPGPPITKTADPLTVPVRQARAQLVAG